MCARLLRGNREVSALPWAAAPGAARGRPEAEARDARCGEVGPIQSTEEVGEQRGLRRGGADGGKGWDQGECGPAKARSGRRAAISSRLIGLFSAKNARMSSTKRRAIRGRKGQWYADRLRQAVHDIRERNPDQSRDRNDDNISLQQHGETLSRGLRASRCKLWGNTHVRLDIGPPFMIAGKSQTKTICVGF